MRNFDLTNLPPWEQFLKRVLWAQLGELQATIVRGSSIQSKLDVGTKYIAQMEPQKNKEEA